MDLSVEEKAVIERMCAEKAEQLKASFHRRTLDKISDEEKIAFFDRCFELGLPEEPGKPVKTIHQREILNPALRNPAIIAAIINPRPGSEEVLLDVLATGDASGAIERQEARGQQELCAKGLIPREGAAHILPQLEALGFQLTPAQDELFYDAVLPDGWSIKPTAHSMHSDLLDEQGRRRGRIFYKAAFYDRKASFHLAQRYSCGMRPLGSWEAKPLSDTHEGFVSDWDGSDIYVSAEKAVKPARGCNHEDLSGYLETCSNLENSAREWVAAHFPDWKDPFAYWF